MGRSKTISRYGISSNSPRVDVRDRRLPHIATIGEFEAIAACDKADVSAQ